MSWRDRRERGFRRRLRRNSETPTWGLGHGDRTPEERVEDQPGTNGDRPWSVDLDGTVDLYEDHLGTDDGTEVVVAEAAPLRFMPDPPARPEQPLRDLNRRPVVPISLRYPLPTLQFAVRHVWHMTAFHVLRAPKYAGQALIWSPRGLTRIVVGLWRWSEDHEGASLRARSVETGDTGAYLMLSRQRDARVRARKIPFWLSMVALGILGAIAVDYLVLGLLALVFVGGYFGRPVDRPWIEPAVVTAPGARKITADMVTRALHAAKLCRETVGPDAPEFLVPGVHRDGKGYGAIVDLPFGFTAQQAIDRRQQVAAGLRVDEFRLFVEQVRGDRGHAGRIHLWIADSDPHSRDPILSPLVRARKWDLWEGVPFGTDARGRTVTLSLVWTSVLIGALPRMGKTNALRLILAAAALDPYVRSILWDGKGGKDLSSYEKVAHAFGAGPDDDVARALTAALTDAVDDMRDRFRRLRQLPDDVCPDGKITPGLSRDSRMRMPLTIIAIDEFQVYLENSKYGPQIEQLLTTLAKIGPATGYILVLSTQRPSSKSMQTDFRDVLGTRFGMRVTTREFSEMILGSGSYKAGHDASKFLTSHKGVGILLGSDDGPLADKGGQTLQTHVMNLVHATAVCDRARGLMESAGTLTGVAAGDEDEALSDKILDHVVAAFRGEEKSHSETLCARMAEDHPGLYDGWDPTDLAAALGRYDIRGRNQIWAPKLEDDTPGNRRGFYRQPIIDVIASRADPIPDSPPDDL